MDRLKAYVPESQQADPLTQDYLHLMEDHFSVCRPKDGIFIDPLSNIPFRRQNQTHPTRAVSALCLHQKRRAIH